VVKRIDVQAGGVDWDDDQRLIVDGVLFTGEAATYNWLGEVTTLATYAGGGVRGLGCAEDGAKRFDSQAGGERGCLIGPGRSTFDG
jgi:hypothetical protein